MINKIGPLNNFKIHQMIEQSRENTKDRDQQRNENQSFEDETPQKDQKQLSPEDFEQALFKLEQSLGAQGLHLDKEGLSISDPHQRMVEIKDSSGKVVKVLSMKQIIRKMLGGSFFDMHVEKGSLLDKSY